MKIDFSNKTIGGFDYEFVRGVSNGAAEIGESLETIERIRNGDFESWIREWISTAARVAAYAESRRQSGDGSLRCYLTKYPNALNNQIKSRECGPAPTY